MRKKNTTEGTGSIRRDRTLRKAYELGVETGAYPLDCYNDVVITDGICYAVTTRTSACNNYFLLVVYEETRTN